jgi:hypothetical protein
MKKNIAFSTQKREVLGKTFLFVNSTRFGNFLGKLHQFFEMKNLKKTNA